MLSSYTRKQNQKKHLIANLQVSDLEQCLPKLIIVQFLCQITVLSQINKPIGNEARFQLIDFEGPERERR
jgi:hypothetical protein